MGLEIETRARKGRKQFDGKLYLDSKQLTFKGPEFRWQVDLGPTLSAQANKDRLMIESEGEKVSFEIGKSVSRWVDKILNPPSRMKKLGVQEGHKFWLSKGFSRPFATELKEAGAIRKRNIEDCEIAFWMVVHRQQLSELESLASQLSSGVNIWIVWTKGSEAIGQNDVMSAARAQGFGPSKTAAFDEQHSSMRFALKKV